MTSRCPMSKQAKTKVQLMKSSFHSMTIRCRIWSALASRVLSTGSSSHEGGDNQLLFCVASVNKAAWFVWSAAARLDPRFSQSDFAKTPCSRVKLLRRVKSYHYEGLGGMKTVVRCCEIKTIPQVEPTFLRLPGTLPSFFFALLMSGKKKRKKKSVTHDDVYRNGWR